MLKGIPEKYPNVQHVHVLATCALLCEVSMQCTLSFSFQVEVSKYDSLTCFKKMSFLTVEMASHELQMHRCSRHIKKLII